MSIASLGCEENRWFGSVSKERLSSGVGFSQSGRRRLSPGVLSRIYRG